MYPELLTHCCYEKQLNQIYTSFDRTLRTLGSAVETEVPVEPEVTLSKIIDWLIWETPTAHVTLCLNSFTTPLIDTLEKLYKKRNVSTTRPSTNLIRRIYLSLPKSAITEEAQKFISSHASSLTLTMRQDITLTDDKGNIMNPVESLVITGEDPRRGINVTNTVYGQLDQHIGTKIRKLTFRSSKNKSHE